jgi:hypothetical protein
VLLNTTALVPKLFACVPNKISEPAELTPNVVTPPVAVIVPVCVMLPPAVNVKLPPTLTVPNCRAALSTRLTALTPVLANDTVPVKLFVVLFNAILLVVFADKPDKFNVVPVFCVTAPLMLLNANVPTVSVTLPKPTVVAFVIAIALAVVFVEDNVPELNCAAPPPALIAIVPVPEPIVPVVCVTPVPVNEIALFVAVIPLLIVNKPPAFNVSVPDEESAPLTVIALEPLVLMLMLPTVFVNAFSVNAALSANKILPLEVFVPPKLEIVFVAPVVFNVVPPTEVTANVAAVIVLDVVSPIVPVDTRLTVLPVPPEMLSIVKAPLLIVTAPPPLLCVRLVNVKAPVLVYDTAPEPVFETVKLPTLLLFVKLKPVEDVVDSEAPVIMLVLVSLIAPVAAVNDTAFAPAAMLPFKVIPLLFVMFTAPVPV